MTLTVGSNGTVSPIITITATVGSSLLASGSVTIPITVNGIVFNRVFTYTKVNGGVTGTSAITYAILSSTNVVVKTKAGVLAPTAITFSATTKVGAAATVAYSGRYKIYESADGTTYGAVLYTSSADEASKVYTPSSVNVKAVKAELYLAGGTATLLDYQGVAFVTDGIDTITSFGSTPLGNVFYNTVGTNPILTAEIDLYNGNTLVTPSAFLWFYQDPSVTTTGSAGYNAKGGLGWHLIANATNLYAGATTRSLSVYANSVVGYELFKCVATYNSSDYPQYYPITDQTDPYQVVIESTGGDKFKNSVGTSILTAVILQGGIELDAFGITGSATPVFASYTWSKYDQNGNLEAFSPTAATMGLTSGTSTTTVVACDAATIAAFAIGSKIIVGSETVRIVSAKTATTLTVSVALAGIPASGIAVKDGSFKRIYINDTNVTVKATFYCDVN